MSSLIHQQQRSRIVSRIKLEDTIDSIQTIKISFRISQAFEVCTSIWKSWIEILFILRHQMPMTWNQLLAYVDEETNTTTRRRITNHVMRKRIKFAQRFGQLLDNAPNLFEMGAQYSLVIFGGSLFSAKEGYLIQFQNATNESIPLQDSQIQAIRKKISLNLFQSQPQTENMPSLSNQIHVLFGFKAPLSDDVSLDQVKAKPCITLAQLKMKNRPFCFQSLEILKESDDDVQLQLNPVFQSTIYWYAWSRPFKGTL